MLNVDLNLWDLMLMSLRKQIIYTYKLEFHHHSGYSICSLFYFIDIKYDSYKFFWVHHALKMLLEIIW